MQKKIFYIILFFLNFFLINNIINTQQNIEEADTILETQPMMATEDEDENEIIETSYGYDFSEASMVNINVSNKILPLPGDTQIVFLTEINIYFLINNFNKKTEEGSLKLLINKNTATPYLYIEFLTKGDNNFLYQNPNYIAMGLENKKNWQYKNKVRTLNASQNYMIIPLDKQEFVNQINHARENYNTKINIADFRLKSGSISTYYLNRLYMRVILFYKMDLIENNKLISYYTNIIDKFFELNNY